MEVDLQFLANLAQVISLPIALIALLIQVVAWFKPQAPAIQPLLNRVKPILPYIIVGTVFFWIGTKINTFTAVNQNTAQSIDTAVPTNVPELQVVKNWRLLINEPFSNNELGWYNNSWKDDDAVGHVYIEKKYRSEVETRLGLGAELWTDYIDLGENYYAEANLQRIRGDNDSGYGLMFHYNRSDDSSYYYFQIKDNKSLLISVKEKQNITKLYTSSSESIRPGEINKLGVLARGTSYSFFVNNVYITTISDPRVKGGKIGFLITVKAGENSIVEMDNFRLYTP